MKSYICPFFSYLFPLLLAWSLINVPLFAQKTLTFEQASMRSMPHFEENKDHFEISMAFPKHARNSQICWQANENEGNFGKLRFTKGVFSLRSFWAKRPWGEFEVVVRGWKNGVKIYEKTILVTPDYQEFTFEKWENIDELTVESAQTYNQIYIDDLGYETEISQTAENSIEIGNSQEGTAKEIVLENVENQGIEEIKVPKKEAEKTAFKTVANSQSSYQELLKLNELNPIDPTDRKVLRYEKDKNLYKEEDSTWEEKSTDSVETSSKTDSLSEKTNRNTEVWAEIQARMPQSESWSFAINRKHIHAVSVPQIDFPKVVFEDETPEEQPKETQVETKSEPETGQNFKAPTDIQLSKNRILENANSQTVIGLLFASDSDKGDRFTYEILEGNSVFGIVENKLVLEQTGGLNAAKKPKEKLRIRAKDSHGLSFEKEMLIEIVAVKKTLVAPPMTIEPVKPKIFNEPNFKLNIKAPKEIKVTIEVISGPVMLMDDNAIQMVNTGKAVLQVSTSGSEKYVPTQQTVEFEVLKAKQAIRIEAIDDKLGKEPPFVLAAKTLSGLPISKWEIMGPAKLVGTNNLQVEDKEGKVTVKAIQYGNELYHPDTATISFWIKRRSQRIVFPAVSQKTPNAPPFELGASSSSGLPVQYKLLKGKADLLDNLLTIKGIEEIVVQAYQEGNETFAPADPVTQTIKLDMSSIFKVADYPKEVRQGETIGVMFEAQKAFAADNQFTLVISDKEGNFNEKKAILGTVAGTKSIFEVKIPENIEVGDRYRFRIESSKPKTVSEVTSVPMMITYKKSKTSQVLASMNETNKVDSKNVNNTANKSISDKTEPKTETKDNAAIKEGVNLKATLLPEKVRIEIGKQDIGWSIVSIMSPSGRTVFQTKTKNVVNYTKEVGFKPTEKGVYWVKVIGEQDIFRVELKVK